MTVPGRASALLAAALSCCLLATGASAQVITLDPDPAWRHASDLPALARVLDGWLDRVSGYPRRATPPRIEIVDRQVAQAQLGLSARIGLTSRGLYDPDSATVYLIAPWSPDRAEDASVLLHELVHHRQTTAQHWYCPGAQEPAAYDLQATWLAERGQRIAVSRIAVVLEAGCTPRDIHPD